MSPCVIFTPGRESKSIPPFLSGKFLIDTTAAAGCVALSRPFDYSGNRDRRMQRVEDNKKKSIHKKKRWSEKDRDRDRRIDM